MERIPEGAGDGRGRRPEILPRPGALVNSSTWAQLWGTRPRPPDSDGTPWGGETAARQGDPTAFLAGVSAPPPARSAALSDPTPALGCPSFQGASGFPERREGQRTRPLRRRSPNSSRAGGETPGRGPRGLRDYNSQRTPGGGAPNSAVDAARDRSPSLGAVAGTSYKIQSALFTDGETKAQKLEGYYLGRPPLAPGMGRESPRVCDHLPAPW